MPTPLIPSSTNDMRPGQTFQGVKHLEKYCYRQGSHMGLLGLMQQFEVTSLG